jgi:hypothetical protein
MDEKTLKKRRLTIAISISDHFTVPWQFAESLIKYISKYPGTPILRAHGSLIHENRNWLIKNTTADRLLMVDTDMVFEPTDVERLEEIMDITDAAVVGALYKSGYEPYKWNAFWPNMERVETVPGEPFEAGGVGMGLTLIDKKAFGGEALFDPIIDADVRHGEDISFCIRTREKGLKVLCDPGVTPGHLRLQKI